MFETTRGIRTCRWVFWPAEIQGIRLYAVNDDERRESPIERRKREHVELAGGSALTDRGHAGFADVRLVRVNVTLGRVHVSVPCENVKRERVHIFGPPGYTGVAESIEDEGLDPTQLLPGDTRNCNTGLSL